MRATVTRTLLSSGRNLPGVSDASCRQGLCLGRRRPLCGAPRIITQSCYLLHPNPDLLHPGQTHVRSCRVVNRRL